MAGNMNKALAVEKTHIPAMTKSDWSAWKYVVPVHSWENYTMVKSYNLIVTIYLPKVNPKAKNINGKKATTWSWNLLTALASKTAMRVNRELCSPVCLAPYAMWRRASPKDSTDATLYSFHLWLIDHDCDCANVNTTYVSGNLPSSYNCFPDVHWFFGTLVVFCDYLTHLGIAKHVHN